MRLCVCVCVVVSVCVSVRWPAISFTGQALRVVVCGVVLVVCLLCAQKYTHKDNTHTHNTHNAYTAPCSCSPGRPPGIWPVRRVTGHTHTHTTRTTPDTTRRDKNNTTNDHTKTTREEKQVTCTNTRQEHHHKQPHEVLDLYRILSLTETHTRTTTTPTCWIGIHAFLWRSHKHTNRVFGLCNPVYDIDMYIFKVTVFMKQAKHE